MEILDSRMACGFCATGAHNHCPSGVWSNDKVYLCPCGCDRSQQRKCLDCNTRDQDLIDPTTWRCFDRDSCQTEIEARLANNPVIQQIRSIRESARERTVAERQTARASSGRPTSGSCLHCGEPTKGGKFLPGHDAIWVTEQVAAVTNTTNIDQLLAGYKELGISEALQGKIKKRIVINS